MKKLAEFVRYALLVSLSVTMTMAQERPKVGLVLSGGGALGFTHIGALQVLEEEHIPIDYIVGTSMGSIIGGLYAAGYSPEAILDMAKTRDWEFVLSDDIQRNYKSFLNKIESDRYLISLPMLDKEKVLTLPGGVEQGQNVLMLFCRLTRDVHHHNDFDDFDIPFACVASNLETGKEYVIRDGHLPLAISSSMAIPTIFAPVAIGDSIYVDGGILNNFPVDVARDMGADILIGVDLELGLLGKDELASIDAVLNQLIVFMGYDKRVDNRNMLDLNIVPDISGYSVASFTNAAADTLAKRGYRAADSLRAQLGDIRQRLNLPPSFKQERKPLPNKAEYYIKQIIIESDEPDIRKYVLEQFYYGAPDTLSLDQIEDGINRIYGTQHFSKVYYRLDGLDEKTLTIFTRRKSPSTLNIGAHYNSIDHAALLLNSTFDKRQLGRASVDLTLSISPELTSSFQFNRKNSTGIGLDSGFKHKLIDIWANTYKFRFRVNYLYSDFYFFHFYKHSMMSGFGAQVEYFDYKPIFISSKSSIHETYTNFFAFIHVDSFDDPFFPTRGGTLMMKARSHYWSTYVNARWAKSLGSRVTILPALYSRILLGKDYPDIHQTMIGGVHYDPYFREPMPFIGVNGLIPVDNYSAIGRLDIRLNLAAKHYVSLMGNMIWHTPSIEQVDDITSMIGGGISYSYKSFLGPLEISIFTSDYHSDLKGFVSFGRWF